MASRAAMAQPRPRKRTRRAPTSPAMRPKRTRGDEGCGQKQQHKGLDDEDEGARVPAWIEREERPKPVVVGPIQQQVAEQGNDGERVEKAPAYGRLCGCRSPGGGIGCGRRGGRAAQADAVDHPEDRDERGCLKREAYEGMGDSAMVLECGHGAAKAPRRRRGRAFRRQAPWRRWRTLPCG